MKHFDFHDQQSRASSLFLWGMLKVPPRPFIPQTHPANFEELRTKIRGQIAAVSQEELWKACSNPLYRATKCTACEGGHLTDKDAGHVFMCTEFQSFVCI
jgi:hypothetical protein